MDRQNGWHLFGFAQRDRAAYLVQAVASAFVIWVKGFDFFDDFRLHRVNHTVAGQAWFLDRQGFHVTKLFAALGFNRGELLKRCGIFTSGYGMAMYLAGKSALLSLTRSMAAELASARIRVNALAPGVIDTDMVRANPPEFQQLMLAGQPMGRMGTPEEIATAALFLASDASTFMTGQCLVVDGGQTTH